MSPMTGRSSRVASSLRGYRCNDYQTVGTPAGKSVRAIESPLLISSYGASGRPADGVVKSPLMGRLLRVASNLPDWTRSLQPDRVPTCTPVL